MKKQYVYAFLVYAHIIILTVILGGLCGPSVKEAHAGWLINVFKKVEYSGHTYVVHISSENFLHDPDCKCMKGKK